MSLVIGITKAFLGDVSIDLRRREGGMPEESLHTPQICSGVEEVCGEGVSQLVWSHVEGDVGQGEVLLEQVVDGAGGEPGAEFGDEEWPLRDLGRIAVRLDGLEGVGTDGNEAFLGALPKDANGVAQGIEVSDIEVGEL